MFFINMRYKWSELFSGVITDCIEDTKLKLNWRKSFGLAKCILRASNRGGRKHRRNNDQKFLKRINRWNSSGFGGLWNEACSMKQSKRRTITMLKKSSHVQKLCVFMASMAEQQKLWLLKVLHLSTRKLLML